MKIVFNFYYHTFEIQIKYIIVSRVKWTNTFADLNNNFIVLLIFFYRDIFIYIIYRVIYVNNIFYSYVCVY